MNKTKRVLSVVLAVLMLSSLIAALAIADEMYTVVINYVLRAVSRPHLRGLLLWQKAAISNRQ